MSFGFSPSDIVTLVKLATKTYQGWKNACGEYADITSMLDGVCVLLERVRDEANTPGSVLWKSSNREELRDVLRGCRKLIVELHDVVVRYKGLSSSRERNWERLRFGVKNLQELRVKLSQHAATIAAYLETIGLGSLTRIEDRLNAIPTDIQNSIDALAAEIRAGRREGSVMTTYDEDEKDVWRQFRRELVTVDGIKSSTLHMYKPLIRQYLRRLAQEGLLEEEEPTDPEVEHFTNMGTQQPVKRPAINPTPAESQGAKPSDNEDLIYGSDSASSSYEDVNPAADAHASPKTAPQDTHSAPNFQGQMYEDIHRGLDWEIPMLVPLECNRITRRQISQSGPRGFVLTWSLPLRPAVAEHHKLLSRYDQYQRRLLHTHAEHFGDIMKFLHWRQYRGRQAFLDRQIPWLPLRKHEHDCTSLTIALPPLWTYEVRGDWRVRFRDWGCCNPSGSVALTANWLPRVFDPCLPLPPGWTTRQTTHGRIRWRHKKSKIKFYSPPSETPWIEPGPSGHYDHAWTLGRGNGRSHTAPRELVNFAALRSCDDWRARLTPLPTAPTSMALWAFFPELQGRDPVLSDVQRQIMHLEWTQELEQANPGMRRHLIEWQDRMDNIARQHSETSCLGSHRMQEPKPALNQTSRVDKKRQNHTSRHVTNTERICLDFSRALDLSRVLDHYMLSPANTGNSRVTDSADGFRITLFKHVYQLGPMTQPIDSSTSRDHRIDEVDEAIFQLFAAEMLCKLEALLSGPPEVSPKDPRNETGSQKWCRIRRLAFACFFAGVSNADRTKLWEAVAILTRTLYGGVTYQPGEFVMWLDLLHPLWSQRGELQRRHYFLARLAVSPRINGTRGVHSGYGSVDRYAARA